MSPRTPEQNKEIREQTRRQIIDAAFELFANEGYSKTSIASVAKKAKVSKGLIYHYFSSKQDILEALFDQLVELSDQMITFPEDFTPKQKVRQILDQSFQFIEHQSGVGKLMIGLALQSEAFETLKPKLDQLQDQQLQMFADIMEEAGYPEPGLQAYQLGALMDGILLNRITLGDAYPLQEMKQKILDEYAPN